MTAELLHVRGVCLTAPGGRPLFRDLTLSLSAGERVALVGRNGVGKSSLLEVLAGRVEPDTGVVTCHGRRVLVPQLLPEPPRAGSHHKRAARPRSPGQRRRACLEAAFSAEPDLLLLDEPTHDLDARNIAWLRERLAAFVGASVVVSHDRRLLAAFGDFFVAAESGCRHFGGTLAELTTLLEREREQREQRYVQGLTRLLDREKHNDTLTRRRQRKRNLGRLHELRRCPSRAKLNENRGYAQQSQGKRSVLQATRMQAARTWARAARRALSVQLPLALSVPELPGGGRAPVVVLQNVAAVAGDRELFADVSMQVGRERIAVTGDNGCGKTTLLEIMLGERRPAVGHARRDRGRIGYVAQDARNWCLDESLWETLLAGSSATGPAELAAELAGVVRAHRFPLALAQRPLRSLSPGERLRAALICLFRRRPAPELLVLDEPTDHLDFVGVAALQEVLSVWPGGLVVTSHDGALLEALDLQPLALPPSPARDARRRRE